MQITERTGSSDEYRYGFNGMEKDDEINGEGNSYNTEFRQYDSRIGRWLTLDPIGVAFESPYAAFRNNPVVYNDQNGDCPDCNGFTTPAGNLMYASNKHYLWDQKGDLVETAEGVVHRINAQGVNYLWNQKLEGYYDSKGEKYSNPDSSWYDGIILGFSEMGKDSKDLGKAIIDNPGGTLENMILGGMRTFDTYLSPTTSDEQEANRALEIIKFKEMNSEDYTKTFTKLIYGIIGSKAIPKTKIKVDLMGGPTGTRGYINYDINAIVGIKDYVANFKKHFPPSTVSSMLVSNPMAHFIDHVTDSMKKGGTITIRGQFANKNFSTLWDADAIPGFQIVKKTRDVNFKGYKTDGTPITGQVNELIIKKL